MRAVGVRDLHVAQRILVNTRNGRMKRFVNGSTLRAIATAIVCDGSLHFQVLLIFDCVLIDSVFRGNLFSKDSADRVAKERSIVFGL